MRRADQNEFLLWRRRAVDVPTAQPVKSDEQAADDAREK
jgi:hypothetical protein